MTNDEPRDIVARCEDALRRNDVLLEHKLLQEATREIVALRDENAAWRDLVAALTSEPSDPLSELQQRVIDAIKRAPDAPWGNRVFYVGGDHDE